MADITGRLSGASGLRGAITVSQGLSVKLSNNIKIKVQSKTVAPTDEVQTIMPDSGYAGLAQVVVGAIPSNYGKITWNGAVLTVS